VGGFLGVAIHPASGLLHKYGGTSIFPTYTEADFFSAEVGMGIVLHDDDSPVIQVHILNCDIKRVLVDFESSADMMY
jgi:hypothetical protein